MVDHAGQRFGHYLLLRSLGEGGFAEVYLGEHRYLKTEAALKLLKIQMTQEDAQAFLREAQTIAHLEHPNIVRVLDFGVQEHIPYLVMSYAPNGSLRSRLAVPSSASNTPTIPINTLLPYMQQIAAALQYAHDAGVVHRDVKPDNMLLGSSDEVLLSDFGIAIVLSGITAQRTRDTLGTPEYMAPEQFFGKPCPASDQYALAISIYEWLCGKRPFQGDAHALGYQHVHSIPPSLCTRIPGLSPEIERVIFKALAKQPEQRYARVSEFYAALDAANRTAVSASTNRAVIAHVAQREIVRDANGSAAYQVAVEKQATDCFICHFNQNETCIIPMLEGTFVAAQERTLTNNAKLYYLTIRTTEGFLASFQLMDDYRSMVRELVARGESVQGSHVRIYHIPVHVGSIDYRGEPLLRFATNQYTLVVLEPDVLFNITDLAQTSYCSRQYLLGRLVSSAPSAEMIRGNLVHACFRALLKQHGHESGEHEQGEPLALMLRQLEEELSQNEVDMALANVTVEEMCADVMPHLESLATWYEKRRSNLWDTLVRSVKGRDESQEQNNVRAETFLLAPEIGLRGRLDLYWQHLGQQLLLELKTGGANGDLPKQNHRSQVLGYHAQLAVRYNSHMTKAQGTLIYSGTPGEATVMGIPFNIRNLQRVNEARNTLVLSHLTGTPPAPPGPSRCTKCAMLIQCEQISGLLSWQMPQPDAAALAAQAHAPMGGREYRTNGATHAHLGEHVHDDDRAFFAHYYALLQLEGRAGEQQLALLWKEHIDARVRRGVAIQNLELVKYEETKQGEWWLDFTCINTSELRKHDQILLSNDDPIKGEVVTGTILEISANAVKVWTPEWIAQPSVLDRYDNDLVHVRTLQNLLRWLHVEPHLRDLVAGRVRPRFVDVKVAKRADFNAEQNLAVERALQMQDYLLIQGPPGTGKTSVIAEIVKRLVRAGQRVLLAAFTNQAVDNMLERLSEEDFHDYIRLGHERSVDEKGFIQGRLLKTVAGKQNGEHDISVRGILGGTAVVASTTATWSSDKYWPQMLSDVNMAPMQFDVAIVDEASQLTVPALLGALRFARNFILVGDDKQLPPLVMSKEAADKGLADSLFAQLSRLDSEYASEHTQAVRACIELRTQYRMNKWIANFSSKMFYNATLRAGPSNENWKLEIAEKKLEGEAAAITLALRPDRPLVFLDVRGEKQKEDKRSAAEATAVQAVIAGLLARGIRPENIGIIAPFRAQVALLRNALANPPAPLGHESIAVNSEGGVTVDTVDRFQGGEREVIIISFATTSSPQGERSDFLSNANRLNVALTRAKRKLILVGCVPALETLPIFERLIRYCMSMRTLIEYTPTFSCTDNAATCLPPNSHANPEWQGPNQGESCA